MSVEIENPLTIKIQRDSKGKVYSYFGGLKTVELADKKKLARIVGSPTLKHLQEKFINNEPVTDYDLVVGNRKLPRPNSATFIKDAQRFLSQASSTNKVNVEWAGCPDIADGYGRVYPLSGKKSFINLWRPIRGFLAKGVYIDLDIDNCHPNLIVQKCEQAGVSCDYLRDYVVNRDLHLKTIQTSFEVDRDCAKKLFLIISYGGSFSDWLYSYKLKIENARAPPQFISDLSQEMIEISKKFVEANPELADSLMSRPGREKNTSEASLVSYVAQTWEREVLEVIHRYLVKKKITSERSVCLCYDGLMIKIPDHWDEKKEEVLKGLEEEIFKVLRLNLKISQKDFDDVLDEVLEEYEELEDAYPFIKKNWEMTHFKCSDSSLFYEVREDKIVTRNKDALKVAFEHLKYISDDGEYHHFIDRWCKDKNMRCYQSAQYFLPPNVCPPHIFNLFRGFDVERIPRLLSITPELQVSLDKLDEHIKFLSNNDEACYKYFYDWLASIFQSPGRKGKTTSGVIKSPQGFGKDMFAEFLKNLLGNEYYFNTSTVERDVLGDFNSCMAGKVLVIGNEVRVANSQVQNLKDFITGSRITINEKKKAQYVIDNNIRFLFFTNLEMPMPIEASDRRFWQYELNGEKPKPEYFNTLANIIKDADVQRAFYDKIMERNISGVDFETDRPKTEFYEESKILSLDNITSFFIDYLSDTLISSNVQELFVPSQDLFVSYKASSYSIHEKTIKWFGHQISRILKNIPNQDDKVSTLYIDGNVKKGRMFNLVEMRNYFLTKGYISKDVADHHIQNINGRLLKNDQAGPSMLDGCPGVNFSV